MKTQVEFRSSRFPPYDGEEEQINPGLWGKRLAEYLGAEALGTLIPGKKSAICGLAGALQPTAAALRICDALGHLPNSPAGLPGALSFPY